MKRPIAPSERHTCIRCGLSRHVNAGRKRKARSTGLCKDCFLLLDWTCPVCSKSMPLTTRGVHLHHSHGLRLADLT